MKIHRKNNHRTFYIATIFTILMSGAYVVTSNLSTYAASTPFRQFYNNNDENLQKDAQSKNKDASNKDTTTTDKKTSSQVTSAERSTTTSTPAPRSAAPKATSNSQPSKTSTAVMPASQQVTQPVSTRPTAPAPTDTAAVIRQLAENQAKHAAIPVTYVSSKISDDDRNQLYKISAITASLGGLLYILSYARAAWRWIYGEPVPVRNIVTE